MGGLGHFLWFIFTILSGGFALPFWILAALIYGSGRRKREEAMKREQIQLLRTIAANQGKGEK